MAREQYERSPARNNDGQNGGRREPPDFPSVTRGHQLRQALSSTVANDKMSPEEIELLADKLAEKLGIPQSGTSPPDGHVASPIPMHASASSLPPRNVYTPPSPERFEGSAVSDSHIHRTDGSLDGNATRSGLRPMSPTGAASNVESRSRSRPAAPARELTSDASPIEKIWGHLFDKETQQPTDRLSQFLRGLALHIIEDYEPKGSLVVTPHKMLRFYTETRQGDEFYPWDVIFGGKVLPSTISHLYRDLKCEHHFIQTEHGAKPSIPGLTPNGFARWMERAILSHPDLEHNRFSYAVLHMPINNADDRTERFPKELPRRLFPGREDRDVHIDFEDALLADRQVELLRRSTLDNPAPEGDQFPPTASPPNSMPPPPSDPRQRSVDANRMSKIRSETSSEADYDEGVTPRPIERPRKPYYAHPGGGKVHNEERPTSPRSEAFHSRSNTTATTTRPVDMPIPDEFRNRSGRPRHGSHADPLPSNWNRTGSPPSGSAPPSSSLHRVTTHESYANPNYRIDNEAIDDEAYLSRQHSRDERRSRYDPRDYPPPPRAPHEDEQYRRRDTMAGPVPYSYYPPPPPR